MVHPLGSAGAATHAAAVAYAGWALSNTVLSPPGGVVAAWVAEWMWILPFSFLFIGVPYAFPGAGLPSRWLRPLVVAGVAMPTAQAIAVGLHPGQLTGFLGDLADPPAVTPPRNPLGLDGAENVLSAVDGLVELAFLPLLLGAIVALILRYRRGNATVRVQIRWLLASVTVLAGMFFASTGIVVPDAVFTFAIASVPASIWVAISRHRLYEIDRLVSRAVTYAVATAALVAVYVCVAMLPWWLFPATRGSDLTVAAATLAVAAAFGPVLKRARAVVDGRFNRARYDAARTIERFGQRLRDELDPTALGSEVRAVAASTFHPTHVSLWTAEGVARR